MKSLFLIFFAFACSPGDLTSYDKEIHYSLKCPDPKDTETPCHFSLNLEPGGYFYVSKDKADTVVFFFTDQRQFYLLKTTTEKFSVNQIDWQNY